MARKPVFRTPLGRRLAAVRERFGKEREIFAEALGGVSVAALANYERGDNVPDATVLRFYHERFGVSLVWLVAGSGTMFDDDVRAPPPIQEVIAPGVMETLYKIADRVYREAGHRLPGHRIAHEAGNLYNALIDTVKDVRDQAVVEAVIPVLASSLADRLQKTGGKPARGRRPVSAS